MSADSWSNCPKCDPNGDPLDEEHFTLRENYEFFFDGPLLNIYYKCYCKRCYFIFEYDKTINVITLDT